MVVTRPMAFSFDLMLASVVLVWKRVLLAGPVAAFNYARQLKELLLVLFGTRCEILQEFLKDLRFLGG